jgi:hypothetical protein
MQCARFSILVVSLIILCAQAAFAENLLELNRSFIEKYKNRLTIGGAYFVDAAHKQPNAAKQDGDMHVAGRSPEIGLATVAEIQNARSSPRAVDAVHKVEGTGQSVQIKGIWRIWPEHGGDNEFIQQSGAGEPFSGTPPTNPPHVSEIHPILQFDQQDVSGNLKPIEGYTAKEAEDAFGRYEAGKFEITPAGDRIRMNMRMIGYNYVEFLMKLKKRFNRVEDGEFVSASIHSLDGELIVHDRRIGFAAGTAPDDKQRTLQVGECMEVLGIPRIDLALVSWRVRNGSPDVLKWSLPYEIIAAGVYEDAPKECGDE